MSSALIVQGGWDGHQPKEVSEILGNALRENGFEVEISDTLDAFKDQAKLEKLDLIIPIWTMGNITNEQLRPLLNAVKGGVGIAGCHGGMGDAFRPETEYNLMVGGQWVDHPGGDGVTYTVSMGPTPHPITAGMSDFDITSEQYYMHVDPANTVIATSNFGKVVMPTTWIKNFGKGRVFYTCLGHIAKDVAQPPVLTMMTRGMLWAAHKLPGAD